MRNIKNQKYIRIVLTLVIINSLLVSSSGKIKGTLAQKIVETKNLIGGEILDIHCDGEIKFKLLDGNNARVLCEGETGGIDPNISPTPTAEPNASPTPIDSQDSPTPTPSIVQGDVGGTQIEFGGFVRGLHESVPRPSVEQVEEGVPECSTHDPNQWHALYDPEKNCHYDHEHGDDPALMNSLFGPVGAWWGSAQSISYPWQTYAFDGSASGGGDNYPERTGGFENNTKHAGYKWFVREGLPCESAYTDGCVIAFRSLDHGMGSSHGAVTRFHSFSIEMVVCPESNPNDCGIVKTGGWQDKGPLVIDGEILTGFGPRNGSARLHYYQVGSSHFGTWYGGSAIATSVTQFEDMWGEVNPTDPLELHLFCPDYSCGSNSSKRQIHIVGVGVRGREVRWLRDNGYVNTEGKVNFTGYTDRYGYIIRDNSCSQVGLDCVPLVLENFTPILYQHRGDAREYDSAPVGVNWIRYPN